MSDSEPSDPLLRFISADALNPAPGSDAHRIQILLGGIVVTGHVIAAGAFTDEALSSAQQHNYTERHTAENDARAYLHLHTDPNEGLGEMRQQKVRIPMDRIDAWWPAPKRS